MGLSFLCCASMISEGFLLIGPTSASGKLPKSCSGVFHPIILDYFDISCVSSQSSFTHTQSLTIASIHCGMAVSILSIRDPYFSG